MPPPGATLRYHDRLIAFDNNVAGSGIKRSQASQ
jgi:hypothetical protein